MNILKLFFWGVLKSGSVAYLFPKLAIGIEGYSGWFIKTHSKFCKKVSCKSVTVGHSELARVQQYLLVDVEMKNVVELVIIWRRQWDTVATNQCACQDLSKQ